MKNIIDDDLRDNYKNIHSNKVFGACSHRLFDYVSLFISDRSSKSALDYGCGQSSLIDLLVHDKEIDGYRYEPSIEEFSVIPVDSVDFVINTEVLEHVPEEILDNVLEKISSLSQNVYFTIDVELADEILPNGDNAHCTVYPGSWWHNRLKQHFPYVKRIYCPLNGCSFITFKPNKITMIKYYSLLFNEKITQRVRRKIERSIKKRK